MAKMMKTTLAIMITVSLVLAAAVACTASDGGEGGNSPKSLAKQNFEATVEYLKLTEGGAKSSDPKIVAIAEKAKELYKKIEQLSEADRAIYDEEYQKLVKESGLLP